MLRLSLALAAALPAAALLPSAAPAAFAPKLAIAVDPATPNVPTALTSTITQASGETPIRRVALKLAPGFGPALGVRIQPCTPEQKDARACPEPSRIGTAQAETQLGVFSGTVHYAPPSIEGPRLYVFLSNGVSFFDQTLEGSVKITPNGYETVFDNLPNVPTTSFRLALEGGPRALIKTPRECADYVFRAELTAQDGTVANAEAPVTVGPCPNRPPFVTDVGLARRGRVVRFTLTEPARVAVEVKRGRKVVTRRSADGVKGDNEVRIKRPKRPGRYRVVVRATDAEGAAGVRSGRLVVRNKRR